MMKKDLSKNVKKSEKKDEKGRRKRREKWEVKSCYLVMLMHDCLGVGRYWFASHC